uniref:Mitochondrial ribosomal protein S18C n=1 Tax=Saimiri boliviensis boliviensis TaxID=39432 RepID=A0A2K6U0W9_SAIBB
MVAMVAICGGLRRKKLTHLVTAAVSLTHPWTHTVPSKEDLPIPMENPCKEPLKKCILCGMLIDYKNVQLLSQFVSPLTGCIYGRHITEIAKAIKRAQIMGFMPVTYKNPAYLKAPIVCNIRHRE